MTIVGDSLLGATAAVINCLKILAKGYCIYQAYYEQPDGTGWEFKVGNHEHPAKFSCRFSVILQIIFVIIIVGRVLVDYRFWHGGIP